MHLQYYTVFIFKNLHISWPTHFKLGIVQESIELIDVYGLQLSHLVKKQGKTKQT